MTGHTTFTRGTNTVSATNEVDGPTADYSDNEWVSYITTPQNLIEELEVEIVKLTIIQLWDFIKKILRCLLVLLIFIETRARSPPGGAYG
jgi:hypothetical protein